MTMVIREDRGAVARLTLNDPDRLNALSAAMIAALRAALDRLAAEPAIRAVVIAAAGKAFCAGHDLREMQAAREGADGGRGAHAALFDDCAALMLAIGALPQPVIAEVQGAAVAAGCQLVAACDMALAADHARFGVNGVNLGLFCSTPSVALTRAIPPKAAFEMLVTGRLIGADEAQRLGLVNRSVPAADLRAETDALADTVAAKLGTAVRLGKRVVRDQAGLPVDRAYGLAAAAMVENLASPDTAEGIDAFLDRRTPDWRQ